MMEEMGGALKWRAGGWGGDGELGSLKSVAPNPFPPVKIFPPSVSLSLSLSLSLVLFSSHQPMSVSQFGPHSQSQRSHWLATLWAMTSAGLAGPMRGLGEGGPTPTPPLSPARLPLPSPSSSSSSRRGNVVSRLRPDSVIRQLRKLWSGTNRI